MVRLQQQLLGDRRAALQFIEAAPAPGEHHEFPARLLADALEVEGYDVRFLGADVPLDSLIHSIEVSGGTHGQKTLLIALTGYGAPEQRTRALESGFDLHLVKPVEPEQLARLIGQERE